MTISGAEDPRVKGLAELCQVLLRRLGEISTELQATRLALAERSIVLTDEEMRAARAEVPEVIKLEDAINPEWVAKRAELEKELAELVNLEPPEPAPTITEADVGIVLGA
jgi:hypothetical protein